MTPSVEFALAAEDLASVRFATSAPHELAGAVAVLQQPSRYPLQWGWLRRVRDHVPSEALRLMSLVIPTTGYHPDFLAPPPQVPSEPRAQVEAVLEASLDLVERELLKVAANAAGGRRAAVGALAANPRRARLLLGRAWVELWEALLEPVWPQIDHVVSADLAYRSRQLVEHGLAAMVGSLHERVTYAERTVIVRTQIWQERVDCHGSGLVLIPSVFSWPACSVVTDPPYPPTIYYPAFAVTENWPITRANQHAALEALLGTGRAKVLLALDGPLSTTEAAQVAGIGAPTASHHLAALRAAGLVFSTRLGKSARHERTTLGQAVCDGHL